MLATLDPGTKDWEEQAGISWSFLLGCWLFISFLFASLFPRVQGREAGRMGPPGSGAYAGSDPLGMVADLDLCQRLAPPCLSSALSPAPLLPHLPVVPLVVSLWLFIRHCWPGSIFREGKSPSLGPKMTVVEELSFMGLTPRERGLDFFGFFFFILVFCGVWFFCGVIFLEWFWFLSCVCCSKSRFLKGETEAYKKKVRDGS